jgi:hypothetical protein
MKRNVKECAVFLAGCIVLAAALAFCSGCASFKKSFAADPMLAPLAPPRSEHVIDRSTGRSHRLTVIVLPGDNGPFCGLPDAANEIRCEFHWNWLQVGDMTTMGSNGWETLSPQGARAACSRALWSIGTLATQDHVHACGFLLMYVRFRDLPPDNTPPEAQ